MYTNEQYASVINRHLAYNEESEDAFCEFLTMIEPFLNKICIKYQGLGEYEDLKQLILVRVAQSLPKIDLKMAFPYIKTVITNTITSEYVKQNRPKWRVNNNLCEFANKDNYPENVSKCADFWLDLVDDFTPTLSEKHQIILDNYLKNDGNWELIAEELELSDNYIRCQMREIKKQARKYYLDN